MSEWFEFVKVAYWLPPVLILVPLLLLHRKRMYPHLPLAIALAAPFVLSIFLLVNLQLLIVILAIDALIIVAATIDILTLPSASGLSAERTTARVASLQKPHAVTVTLTNAGGRDLLLTVRDDVPLEFTSEPEECDLRLEAKSRQAWHYEMTAKTRGAFAMHHVYLRMRSRFGLWKRYYQIPAKSTVHVYPDLKQLAEYAVLARTNRLSLMGVRRTRRIGQDNEFERLRDYAIDDNYKHIDWRTTARRNKLTVKDFQTNQSQRIIFMLDCGRMMTNESSGLSLLDHALNSALMLSYVALRQGDSVGLLCFSDEVHAYVPPHSGGQQMNKLLHASFDRFPRLVESRYDEAFLYLASTCRKRSLVVLITNLIDEVNSNQIEQYLGSLVGRHLPLGVLLRDHQMFDALDHPPRNDAELFHASAAAEILGWRHQVLTDLQHQGVLSLDVFPEHMTAPLINQYLNIKARHLL